MLRGLAAGAAATAVVGAVVMRHWDVSAGKRVADLTRARASDEWRHEERVAELETDLDESRELRTKLEHRLREKRAELQGLRNEHAALLRRYATAETERASVLESRRRLAIEATTPARAALPAAASADAVAEATEKPAPAARAAAAVLYAKANAALDRLAEAATAHVAEGEPWADGAAKGEAAEDGSAADASEDVSGSSAVDGSTESGSAQDAPVESESPKSGSTEGSSVATDEPGPGKSPKGGPAKGGSAKGAPVKAGAPKGAPPAGGPGKGGPTPGGSPKGGARKKAPATGEAGTEGEAAQGKPEAVGGHERTAAATAPAPAESDTTAAALKPALKPALGSGHFTVPKAVAVAPTPPVRRPSVEGGFDFFGTQQEASEAALEAVQNEDLADVVGQEALALHKAESEAQFKPADEESRSVGQQVIDLTAHDETEQIDVAELRSAVS
ncbi:hypothetical protein GCM10023080_013830 [Streptomyces pseudoechinosporeus]